MRVNSFHLPTHRCLLLACLFLVYDGLCVWCLSACALLVCDRICPHHLCFASQAPLIHFHFAQIIFYVVFIYLSYLFFNIMYFTSFSNIFSFFECDKLI